MNSIDDIMSNLMQDAHADIEKQLSDKIRLKFPNISDFTVNYIPNEEKFNITGLTEEQLSEVLLELQ
jgi:hypothetical protein